MSRPPPEPPHYDPAKTAMVLLAVLVCTGALLSVMVTLFCLLEPATPKCAEKEWGTIIKGWLESTIPVIIAIIMRGPQRPPPPPPPP